jgi:hypothetical protein
LESVGRHFDYLNRLAPTVEFLKQIGVWYFPHPWIDLMVPTSRAESFIGGTLATLDPADVGQGPILIYPYLGNHFDTPNLRVPAGETFFLFGLLRTAIPPTPDLHFGERWPQFFAAKRAFDPDALLAPGQGIFTAR